MPAVYSAVIFECQKLTVPGMATISTIKHSILDNLTSSDLQITGVGRSKFEPLYRFDDLMILSSKKSAKFEN